MKWIVVMPGGQWQESLVRYLLPRYRVAVVNPFRCETTDVADLWIAEDIMNVGSYADRVKQLNPVTLITDQCDVALEPVRALADAINVDYHPQKVIDIFRDKFCMYQHANKCGIMQPQTRLIRTAEEAETAISEIGRPFVIKPTDSNSSIGLQFSESYDVDLSVKSSYRKTAIVQKFISGRHLSVDGVIVNGRHRSLAVGERFYIRPGVIGRVDYTADVTEEVINKLFDAADKFVNKSGAKYGITHAEFFLDGDTPYLGEIALRGGGCGTSSHVVPWVSGYDPAQALVAGHLKETALEPGRVLRRFATIKFFEFDSGVVQRIDDNVFSCHGVVLWKLWVKPGDVLSPARDGKGRHACMIVLGDSSEEVNFKLDKASKEINVQTK